MPKQEIEEYQLHQLVHRRDSSIGFAQGDQRTSDDGKILEEDTYEFLVQGGRLQINVLTDVFRVTQQTDGYVSRGVIDRKSRPVELPEGTTFQLIEPQGERGGYEHPSSPAATFREGISKIVNVSKEDNFQPPTLRITRPK